MIQPANYTIVMPRNGVFRENWQIQLDGVGIDLTGWKGRLQIRPVAGDEMTPFIDVSTEQATATGSAISGVDIKNGILEVYFSHTDIQQIPEPSDATRMLPVQAVFDLVLTEPGGDFYPWIAGTATVNEGVTRMPA